MNFEFRFEFLLRHRKRLEEIARRDYAQARRELEDCLAGIDRMYLSIEETRVYIAEQQRLGTVEAVIQIRDCEAFIEGQKIRITKERERARGLMRVAEDKQELLIEAAKNHKMIGKLKERKRKQFRKDKKRIETKRIDDLVVIRSQRGRAI